MGESTGSGFTAQPCPFLPVLSVPVSPTHGMGVTSKAVVMPSASNKTHTGSSWERSAVVPTRHTMQNSEATVSYEATELLRATAGHHALLSCTLWPLSPSATTDKDGGDTEPCLGDAQEVSKWRWAWGRGYTTEGQGKLCLQWSGYRVKPGTGWAHRQGPTRHSEHERLSLAWKTGELVVWGPGNHSGVGGLRVWSENQDC